MLSQFIKYNAVGIVNTLFGFSMVLMLMYGGLSPVMSNAIGYGFGAILSYVLNSKYTFKVCYEYIQAFKFFAVLSLAYGVNYIVLQYLLPILNPYIAQLISAVVYTMSSFVLMKVFVFHGTNLK